MTEVTQLFSPLQSYIRSGIAIPSFSQCAEELIANSLDAGCTVVSIHFDINEFSLRVTDDGCGFTESSLEWAGHRYSTSKCASLEDVNKNLKHYGFRGEALASIARVSSSMLITSRRTGSRMLLYKTIENNGKLQQRKKMLHSVATSNETTVRVHGLYSNMPVRRQPINVVTERDNVRRRVEKLAIMHPATSFSIIDDQNPESSGELRLSRQKNALCRFQDIFGHIEPAHHMQSVEYSSHDDAYVIEGGISKQGFDTKELQFLFVNGRPVYQPKIQKKIHTCLKNSMICRQMEDARPDLSPNDGGRNLYCNFNKRSVRRKYGVYCLNIKCPRVKYDICFEPEKNMVEFSEWPIVLQAMNTLMERFIDDHNLWFLPKNMENVVQNESSNATLTGEERKDTTEEMNGQSAENKYTFGDEFATEGITVSGTSAGRKTDEIISSAIDGVQGVYWKNCISPKSTSNKEPSISAHRLEDANKSTHPETSLTIADYATVTPDAMWISKFDSKLGKTVYINIHNGMSSFIEPNVKKSDVNDRKEFGKCSSKHSRLSTPLSTRSMDIQTPIFTSWANPCFSRRIDVIGQADQKFIFCSLERIRDQKDEPDIFDNVLIVFDQHAVHERIRLEELENDIYKDGRIISAQLSDDLIIPIHKHDISLIKMWIDKFSKVGLEFCTDQATVKVSAVPEPLFRKACKLTNSAGRYNEISDLVQKLIQEQVQHYRSTSGTNNIIPKTIFDILCSEACHGAIKFGDPLSRAQCKLLLDSLSRCRFPFQCAHGRPSLTPLNYPTSC